MLTLYKNIKKKRAELRMTQEELAKRMGYADKSMISRIENGDIDLPLSKIIAFAKVLEVKPGSLLGYDGVDDVCVEDSILQEIIDCYKNLTEQGKNCLLEQAHFCLRNFADTEKGEVSQSVV